MKKLSLFLIVSIFFSCSQQKAKKIDLKASKDSINILLDNWHKAAAKANYDVYFSKMDSVSVFIGTDASENWQKNAFQKFSKPYFDKGKAWSFTPIERNIYFSKTGDIAWFDELLKTQMGICRGSGVLEKTAKNWEIKHYVLSITIPNDNVKKVVEINRKKDSLFIQNLENR